MTTTSAPVSYGLPLRWSGDEGPSVPQAAVAATGSAVRRFRPDIEGLRAVAVLLVVLYHSHVPGIRGGYVGVDVFFVISGFLITRQLTDELHREGRISLVAFYGRRAKRLLPASAVVTIVTVLAATQWLSPLRAKSVLTDGTFTTFYALNVRLAQAGTSYLTASAPPSPLQHYWSLAVEEQFYVIWPLLILMAALLSRHRRRAWLLGTISALGIASLVACVVLTRSSQPWAYFSLPTRAWELAAGALVALTATRLTALAPGTARLLSWAGLAALVSSAFVLTDASAFPGYLALLPVLGAAAVIAGGCASPRGGAESLLRRAPMQWGGKVSYGWYLWHWPVLVIAPAVVGHDLGVAQDLGLSGLSLGLALLSYLLIESPARRWRWLTERPGRALGVGAALAAVVLVTTTQASALIPSTRATGAAVVVPRPSATGGDADAVVRALVASSIDARNAPSNLTPTVDAAVGDVPASMNDGCQAPGFDVVAPKTPCAYGDLASPTTVVLYGDSHAGQWLPTLAALGQSQHWRVDSRTKVSCPATAVSVRNKALKRAYTECDAWRVAALADIATLHPAVVFMSSAVSIGADDVTDAAWAAGTRTTIERFTAMGARVVLLADTARTKAQGVDCVAANVTDLQACRLPSSLAYYYPKRRAADMAVAAAAGALVVDPDPWFCAGGFCPAVVGPYLVFRDSSHLTATYAAFLAPALLTKLAASTIKL